MAAWRRSRSQPVAVASRVCLALGMCISGLQGRRSSSRESSGTMEGGSSGTIRGSSTMEGGSSGTIEGSSTMEGSGSGTIEGSSTMEGGSSGTIEGSSAMEGSGSSTIEGSSTMEGGSSGTIEGSSTMEGSGSGTTEGSGDFNLEGSGDDVEQPNEGNLSSIFSRVPSCDRYLETSVWQYNWDYNDYFWIEGRLFVVALSRNFITNTSFVGTFGQSLRLCESRGLALARFETVQQARNVFDLVDSYKEQCHTALWNPKNRYCCGESCSDAFAWFPDEEGVGPETASLFRQLISSGRTQRVVVRPGRAGYGSYRGAVGCAVCMCDYDLGYSEHVPLDPSEIPNTPGYPPTTLNNCPGCPVDRAPASRNSKHPAYKQWLKRKIK